MTVYLLFDDEPEPGELRLIAVYASRALATKAMKVLQGEAGDSYTWQYLRIESRKVIKRVTR